MFHVEHQQNLSDFLIESALALGIRVEAEQSRQCLQYLDMLKSWNKTTNLTSITDDREIVTKHFVDSIATIKAVNFDQGSLLFDVGTGAGFPGLPIKIMRPDLRMVLIEPSKKKCSFLRYVVGLLRLTQIEIYEGSLESFAAGLIDKERASYVLARGIKYDFLLRLAPTILVSGGRLILFLSSGFDEDQLPTYLKFYGKFSFDLPLSHGHREITSLVMI